MGYTHYISDKKPIDDDNWELINKFAVKLFEKAKEDGVVLCNGMGEEGTEPVIEDNIIMFNGCGEYSHETVIIDKFSTDFDFCKTAMKPYDDYVVAIYWLLDKLEIAEFSSDGEDNQIENGINIAINIMNEMEN